jgi:hypothetical protein
MEKQMLEKYLPTKLRESSKFGSRFFEAFLDQ